MFGLFYVIFHFGSSAIASVKKFFRDEEMKHQTYDPISKICRNSSGHNFDTETGKQMFISRDKNGDVHYHDLNRTKNINYSELHRENEYNQEQQNYSDTHTVMKYGCRKRGSITNRDGFSGTIYKDLKNGRLYLAKKMIVSFDTTKLIRQREIGYYLDIDTFEFVRPTDQQIISTREFCEKHDADYNEEMRYIMEKMDWLNELQQKKKAEGCDICDLACDTERSI